MKRLFIKQGIFLPLIYFGTIIIAGIFASDYSHFGQHASELGINSSKIAVILFQVGIIATSISMFILAIGLRMNFRNRFYLTPILVFIFGITFIFGAIFPIGSPWHGFYGFGLMVMLIPFVFLYELDGLISIRALHIISLIAGLLMFLYLWSMIAGLDHVNYRGLTQRIFGLVVFGWLSYISFHLNRVLKENSTGT
jgi:hypothetical protein